MKLSVRLFGFPLRDYAPLARRADELGFEAAWIPEHLVAPLEFDTVYPYRDSGRPSFLPQTPFGDPWVMLGNLAAVTSRILLGVGVYVLPLRNPFVTAKSVATVQELSCGRVLLGAGIGWMREEFETVGERFESRGARTEEMIEVMRKLWTGLPVEHAGRFYRFRKLQMSPGLTRLPPLMLGGTGELALKRAARMGEGWYAPPCDLEAALRYRDALNAALAGFGRERADFRIWVRTAETSDLQATKASLAQYRAAGFGHLLVHVPRDLPDNAARLSWLERLAALQ